MINRLPSAGDVVAQPVSRTGAAVLPQVPTGLRRGIVKVLQLLAAALAGLLLFLSFQPRPLWWLAPVGLAVLYVVVRGRGVRAGLMLGFVTGLAFMYPLLAWTGEFVGLVGSVPLSVTEAALVAVSVAGIAVVSERRGGCVWAALVWVAGESLRAVLPFGGFPWAKLAFSQVDGVLAPVAVVGGTPLVSLAVAGTGFGLAELFYCTVLTRRVLRPRRLVAATLGLMIVSPTAAGLLAARLVDTAPESGTAVIAAVQGNVPRAGLDFNAQRRAVLDNHVNATLRLAADVRAGRQPQPDLVIWPENSSDIDPFTNPDAYTAIQTAAEAVGAPVVVGAVVGGGTPAPRNTAVLWDPQRGPGERYLKRRLQPFGETMPFRSFFRLFSRDVDRAGRFVPGTEATVLSSGPVRLAVTMCYEVIFDGVVRDSVRNGSNLLTVPSNNATFGYTDMTYQQLAIDRFRAIEHGRAVIVATTSGVSAIIRPDGTVTRRSQLFSPALLVDRVPLRDSLTVADRLGPLPEAAIALAAVASLGVALVARRPSAQRPLEPTSLTSLTV